MTGPRFARMDITATIPTRAPLTVITVPTGLRTDCLLALDRGITGAGITMAGGATTDIGAAGMVAAGVTVMAGADVAGVTAMEAMSEADTDTDAVATAIHMLAADTRVELDTIALEVDSTATLASMVATGSTAELDTINLVAGSTVGVAGSTAEAVASTAAEGSMAEAVASTVAEGSMAAGDFMVAAATVVVDAGRRIF